MRMGLYRNAWFALAFSASIAACRSGARTGAVKGEAPKPVTDTIGVSHKPHASKSPRDTLGVPHKQTNVDDFRVHGVGDQPSNPLNYRQAAAVRIVVRDVNPFIYDYRVLVNEHPYAEISPADFFNIILGITSLPGPLATVSTRLTDSTNVRECPGEAADHARRFVLAANQLAHEGSTIASFQRKAETAIGEYDTVSNPYTTVLRNPQKLAPAVDSAAKAARNFLDKAIRTVSGSIGQADSRIAAFSSSVAELKAEVAPLREKAPFCYALADSGGLMRELVADTLTLKRNQDSLNEWVTSAKGNHGILVRVTNNPSYYYLTRTLNGYTGPTDVAVRVQRKPAGDADTTKYREVTEQRLNFGGKPRLALSVGMAWSDLVSRDYMTTRSYAPATPVRSADSLVNVVVLKQQSYNRVVPMLMLNTRVVADAFATLGATVRRQNDNTDAEFLLAGSYGLFGERLLLSAGTYVGRTTRLSGGLSLNSRLPEGASVPTRSRIDWRPGLAFSYKLR